MAIETTINPTHIPFVISCISSEIHFAATKTETVAEIVFVVINIMISVLGTLANGIVITVYYCNRRLRTIQNTIFLLLAATDIGVTVIVQPIHVVATLTGLMGKRDCLIWVLVILSSWLFLSLSLATINILSWQSYITLAYPYQAIVTKHRLKIAVFFTWLLMTATVLKSTFLHYLSLATYICAGVILLTIISVFFTWAWTYRIVARHRKVIQTTQTPSAQKLVARKAVLRSTITALVVTLGLFVCYSFRLLLYFYEIVNAWSIERNILLILHVVSWTLLFLNSLLNPCMVFWRSSGFRQAARNILIKNL